MFTTNVRVFTGSLGLYDRQRQTVSTKQDIVHISHLADYASHTLDRVLLLHIGIYPCEFPTHLLYINIDINLAGFEFREVSCHESTILLMLFLSCGNLLGHLLNLFPQGFYLGIFFSEQTLLLFDFLCINNNFFLGDKRFIKLSFLIVGAIAIVHPLDELK